MQSPILHEQTARAIKRQLAHPANSLILHGPKGVGKDYVAEHLARQLLSIAKLDADMHYVRIDPSDKGSISIESIRQVVDFLRLKVPGANNTIQRVVHISSADTMTIEAQNALLKTLEEPPADTVLLLCVSDLQQILSTILSRSQQLRIEVPSFAQIRAGMQPNNVALFDRNIQLSGGLPGLLYALDTQAAHPLVNAIEYAKQFISVNHYQRLIMVNNLQNANIEVKDFLWAIERIARIGQQSAAQKGNDAAVQKWQAVRKQATKIDNLLGANASNKLALTSLSLHI